MNPMFTAMVLGIIAAMFTPPRPPKKKPAETQAERLHGYGYEDKDDDP